MDSELSLILVHSAKLGEAGKLYYILAHSAEMIWVTWLVGDGGGWVVMVVISSAKTFPCLRVVFLSGTSIIYLKMSL